MDLTEVFLSVIPDGDLVEVKRKLIREVLIRRTMGESGETREVVAEAVDAVTSMESEAVLDLTDGEPTTLRDALGRYVAGLDRDDPDAGWVVSDLQTLLDYPWPGESALSAALSPHGTCSCEECATPSGNDGYVVSKGWLNEHLDRHVSEGPVDGCTFCSPQHKSHSGHAVHQWCPRQPWCLKPAGHQDDCHETDEERMARINAQAMRNHPFAGDGQYCEAWSSPSYTGNPTTGGVISMRAQCGYPREHHSS